MVITQLPITNYLLKHYERNPQYPRHPHFPQRHLLLLNGLAYEWVDRKMLARLQNRVGPRWFQPVADVVKLLVKEEVLPRDANHTLFILLPIIAVAGPLTAALYVPIAGLPPAFSFQGDLIVTLYLLSLLTLCTGLAGANTRSRFSLLGPPAP